MRADGAHVVTDGRRNRRELPPASHDVTERTAHWSGDAIEVLVAARWARRARSSRTHSVLC